MAAPCRGPRRFAPTRRNAYRRAPSQGRETLLTGETLHLSLPLMRVLSAEDLAGIVAHELAHFRGSDTAYSLSFLPIHAGVTRALVALEAEAG